MTRLLHYTSFLTFVSAFTLICPALAEQLDLPALVRKARPAVVLLTLIDAQGKETGAGTGFFVTADGKIITNWHVAKEADAMVARLEDGSTVSVRGVLAVSPQDDLALLQADTKPASHLVFASPSAVEVGSRIAVIGSPLGLEGTLSDGIVSAKRKLGGAFNWIQITAPISPGSSGSPVLNAEGQVVGVATMHLKNGQALNFAAPGEAAKGLLDEAESSPNLREFKVVQKDLAQAIWDDPRVKQALDSIKGGDFTGALESVQSLVKQHADNADMWHLQGAILATLEFIEDAIVSFQKANELNAQMPENWYDLGLCYIKLKGTARAIPALKEAIKLKPRYLKAWEDLGSCYKEMQEWQKALVAFDQACKISPADAENYYNAGWCLRQMKQYDEAMGRYEIARGLQPKSVLLLNSMAYIHIVQGKPNEAMALLKEAIACDPKTEQSYINIATAYGMKGEWSEAAKVAETLRQMGSSGYAETSEMVVKGLAAQKEVNDPKAKEARQYYDKAQLLLTANRLPEAITAYSQAVKRQPKNAQYWCRLGVAHGHSNELKDAFNCFSEALKLDPRHAESWRNIGLVHKARGDVAKAKEAAEQAIRTNPEDGLAMNDLGVLMMEAKNFNYAIMCFEGAVKVMPTYDFAWRNLGVVYCTTGRADDARRVLATLLQRGSREAADVEQAIAQAVHSAPTRR